MRNRFQPLLLLLACWFGSNALSVFASSPPYPGHAPDAPWRRVAAERIEKHCKSDLQIRVVDLAGNPVPGARVTVDQTRHAFRFGSAVKAWMLRGTEPEHDIYRARVLELFNAATLENNLKHTAWSGQKGKQYTRVGALWALDWLRDRQIAARGHVMVWPSLKRLPNGPEKELVARGNLSPAQQERVRAWLATHIRSLAGATAGRIVDWDVLNEPRKNHVLMDVLPEGDAVIASWFRLAREVAPEAGLYLNEYNILSSGGEVDSANQRLLESQARALQAAGAPISGVGLQSHFREHSITGPEQLWEIVDRYAALGLDVQVTEFDLETDDEQLQADYLRDFYTAMFAHEGVSAITMWGFWEGAHWRPRGALYREDWSPKPAARVYKDLVLNQWWTREAVNADPQGSAVVRAFHGDHRVRVTYGESSVEAPAQLSDDGLEMTFQLGVLTGDYNRDGFVNTADYAVLRGALDQEVANPGAGADGDGDGRVTMADKEVWADRVGAKAPKPEKPVAE